MWTRRTYNLVISILTSKYLSSYNQAKINSSFLSGAPAGRELYPISVFNGPQRRQFFHYLFSSKILQCMLHIVLWSEFKSDVSRLWSSWMCHFTITILIETLYKWKYEILIFCLRPPVWDHFLSPDAPETSLNFWLTQRWKKKL